MNILMITARFPFPPLKGDQAVSYNRILNLEKSHKVTLLTFYRPSDLKYRREIQDHVSALILIPFSFFRATLGLLAGFFLWNVPFQVLYYRNARMKKAIRVALATIKYDIVNLFMLRMSSNYVNSDAIIDLNDSMVLNFTRRLARSSGPLTMLIAEELRRLRGYERSVVERYRKAIVVSEIDANSIGSRNIVVLPLGVTIRSGASEEKDCDLVFTGNLGYSPNQEAVRWFLDAVFPKILEELPACSLCIVGSSPPDWIRRIESENVKVTGFVSDIHSFIRRARVSVAPMQSGSGMQFKILEAAFNKVPVVATHIGLGAIQLENGSEILVEQTSRGFATSCVRLLKDSRLSATIANGAYNKVSKLYTWEKNSSGFLKASSVEVGSPEQEEPSGL